MAVGGSPRFLLLRESLVSGMIGIVFLGSLLLPRPLAYYLARSTVAKQSPQELNTFEVAWPKPRFVRMPWPYLHALNQVRSKSEGPELAASRGG
jgi:hypothetical protein